MLHHRAIIGQLPCMKCGAGVDSRNMKWPKRWSASEELRNMAIKWAHKRHFFGTRQLIQRVSWNQCFSGWVSLVPTWDECPGLRVQCSFRKLPLALLPVSSGKRMGKALDAGGAAQTENCRAWVSPQMRCCEYGMCSCEMMGMLLDVAPPQKLEEKGLM